MSPRSFDAALVRSLWHSLAVCPFTTRARTSPCLYILHLFGSDPCLSYCHKPTASLPLQCAPCLPNEFSRSLSTHLRCNHNDIRTNLGNMGVQIIWHLLYVKKTSSLKQNPVSDSRAHSNRCKPSRSLSHHVCRTAYLSPNNKSSALKNMLCRETCLTVPLGTFVAAPGR